MNNENNQGVANNSTPSQVNNTGVNPTPNPTPSQVNNTGVNPAPNPTPSQVNNVIKKGKKKKIIVILIFLILLALGAFFGYPYVRDNIINSPQNVFNRSIDNVFKTMSNNVGKYGDIKGIYELNMKLETNESEFKSYSDYTYSLRYGVDSNNKLSEAKLMLKDKNNKEYSFAAYLKII